MEDKEINLISEVTRKSLRFVQLKKKVNIFTTVLLSIFVLALFSVFAVLIFYQKNFDNNKTKIVSLKSQIQALYKTESYVLTISDRLTKIEPLLKKRSLYVGALSSVESLVIPGFTLKSLEILPEGSIKLGGNCQNSQMLADFRDRAEQTRENDKYSRLIYHTVRRKEDGSYELFLELTK